ncbi:MAG: FkbM family methyltransferase [Candidatus Pacebacteria bacterium]|nr:FkbM family methyltransferase [Candidatus Paceibacterota bacterium]
MAVDQKFYAFKNLMLRYAASQRVDFKSWMVYDHFYPVANNCQVKGLSKIYESIFGKTTEGLFVEVGAFDGQNYSNTAGLADIGWRGLYIEPILESAMNCTTRHRDNNCLIVNQAVGAESGLLKLVFGNGMEGAFTTSDPEMMAKLTEHLGMEYEAEMVTLDTVLQQNGIEPSFELLVIDIEGYEENLFKAFDIDYYLPRMMIVELCDIHPEFVGTEIAKSAARVRDYIVAKNYQLIYGDNVNSVFVLESLLGDD